MRSLQRIFWNIKSTLPPEIDFSKTFITRPSTVSNPPHFNLPHLTLTYLNPTTPKLILHIQTHTSPPTFPRDPEVVSDSVSHPLSLATVKDTPLLWTPTPTPTKWNPPPPPGPQTPIHPQHCNWKFKQTNPQTKSYCTKLNLTFPNFYWPIHWKPNRIWHAINQLLITPQTQLTSHNLW
jgi:hypothetical protein